jgi:hypothetical protein
MWALPTDIDDTPVIIVSIVGINRAGKTYFLATALQQALREGALEVAQISDFSADEDTSQKFHREYYKKAFRGQETLAGTDQRTDIAEPLIFRFHDSHVQRFLLAMHDIAGEDISDQRRRAAVAPFIRHADGLIFVVDPLEIDTFRHKLPRGQVIGYRDWHQPDVLRACMDTVDPNRGAIPVNVVITKSDLITLVEGQSFTFSTPTAAGENWWAEQPLIDKEVRAILRQWGATEFESVWDQMNHGNFHAVSALGRPPLDANNPVIVKPLRCSDALATMLAVITDEYDGV